jgi:hypothetical protein
MPFSPKALVGVSQAAFAFGLRDTGNELGDTWWMASVARAWAKRIQCFNFRSGRVSLPGSQRGAKRGSRSVARPEPMASGLQKLTHQATIVMSAI